MSNIRGLIARHPVSIYFALTFLVSWGLIFAAHGPDAMESAEEIPAVTLGVIYLAMLAGPAGAALLLTGLGDGRVGLRTLAARMVRWRVGVRWYAVAVLTAPSAMVVTTGLLLPRSAEYLPALATTGDRLSLILSSLVIGIVVGLFEEIGWTGYAVPRLRLRHGALTTGVLIGLVWGAWHFPLFRQVDTFSRILPAAILAGRLFAWLPPYRILMVYLYDRTESGSLSVLMHASLVASQFILMPAGVAGVALLLWLLTWAGVLWATVGLALAVQEVGHRSQRHPASVHRPLDQRRPDHG